MKTTLRPDDTPIEEYRKSLCTLAMKVNDEKLIRRVWRLLDIAYNEQ